MLLLHIIIAVSTVGISGYTLLKPSSRKIKLSYLFTAATFATGTYLVIISPAHLISACITGLVFLGVVGSMLIASHTKLAHVSPKEKA